MILGMSFWKSIIVMHCINKWGLQTCDPQKNLKNLEFFFFFMEILKFWLKACSKATQKNDNQIDFS